MAKKKEPVILDLPDSFNIAAADLSFTRPGFCLMTFEDGKITSVKTFSNDNKEKIRLKEMKTGEVLESIFESLANLHFDNKNPTYYVREKAFNSRGAQSEIKVYEVVGLTDWWLWNYKSEWNEIYPVSVKKAVTGSGKADKKQVEKSLEHYVGKLTYNNDDESDATAVACAFLIQNKKLECYTKNEETKEEVK